MIRDYTYTEKEAAAEAIALAAMVTDHEARIRALEDDLKALTRDVKTDLPDAPTWDQLPRADWWMPDTLLSDGGKVWRNTSGTVLTTPPSEFPGAPSQWTRLFVEVSGGAEPEPSEWPAWKPWDNQPASLYAQDAKVSHNGRRWIANVGNNHWEPGVYGWTDAGPA